MKKKINQFLFYPYFFLFIWIMIAMVVMGGCKSLTPAEQIEQARTAYVNGKKERFTVLSQFAQGNKEGTVEDRKLAIAAIGTLPRETEPKQNELLWKTLVHLTKDPAIAPFAFQALQKRREALSSLPLIEIHKAKPTAIFVETLGFLQNPSVLSYLYELIKEDVHAEIALQAMTQIHGEVYLQLLTIISLNSKISTNIRIMALSFLPWRLEAKEIKDPLQLDFVQVAWQKLVLEEQLPELLRSALKKEIVQKGDISFRPFLQENFTLFYKKKKMDMARFIAEIYAELGKEDFRQAWLVLRGMKKGPPVSRTLRGNELAAGIKPGWTLSKTMNKAAKKMGLNWDAEKQKKFVQKIDRQMTNISRGTQFRFQRLYEIMARRYPDKGFYEIQLLMRQSKQRDQLLQLLIFDTMKRYPQREYAIYYLSSYLSISKQEAELLIKAYYGR